MTKTKTFSFKRGIALAKLALVALFFSLISPAMVSAHGNGQIMLDKTANVSNLPAGGGSVTYTFTVTNTDGALRDVAINDPGCSPVNFVSGDANSDNMLQQNESWVYSCTKNITATTTNTATVTGVHDGTPHTATDSVTVTVADDQNQSGIHLEKSANPANLPVGGGNVTYTMAVTNTGNSTLSNVVLSDPGCSPISSPSGDANNNQMLEVSETWTYTCSENVTASGTNTASVTGTFNGQNFTDEDSATVTVASQQEEPKINIEKTANAVLLPAGGGNVTYTMTVTNPGVNAISNVVVNDPSCSPLSAVAGDANSNNMLESTETWVYTCSKNVTATVTNTATVTGVVNGVNVSAHDSVKVIVSIDDLIPQIKVEKSANPTSLPMGGGSVMYTFKVTNPGSVALRSVFLWDNSCSPISGPTGDANSNNRLEMSETWTYTCTKNLTATTTNIAVATGFANGLFAIDTDRATVTVGNQNQPSINVVKAANPTSVPAGGGNVTYTITVTNNGVGTLSNVMVNDPGCSPMSAVSGDANSNQMLESTETWVYTCSKNVTANTTNTVNVSGVSNGVTVTDQASATVGVNTSNNPSIHIEKSANPSNLPAGGGNVTYTMTVTNNGNQTLSNIVLSDPGCSPISSPSGDANNNQMLEVSETWTYTCSENVTASGTNTASVTGTFNGQNFTDTASANVTVAANAPAINLAKSANPSNLAVGGGNVTYTLTVTNVGNQTLSNIVLNDPGCSPMSNASGDANNNQMLEVSETWVYTCSKNVTQSGTNTATVTGTFNGQNFNDEASVTVNVATVNQPAISLAKSVNNANLPFGGGNVTYTLTVTNPGNQALSNIVLNDPGCSPMSNPTGDTNNNQILNLNETWTFTCSKNVTASGTNTATVTGTFNGQSFSDTASVSVNVAGSPSINLAKVASVTNLGVGGGNVTYTMTVTNPNNSNISSIVLSDPGCSPVSSASGDANNNNIIEANETWTYTCTKNVTATGTNTATVTGVVNGTNVSNTASATVNVATQNQTTIQSPVINVTKTPSPTFLTSTGSATFNIRVTNPGQVALSNVTVTDNTCSPVSFVSGGDSDADGLLDVGEVWNYTCTMNNISSTTTNTVTVTGRANNLTATDTASGTVVFAPQTIFTINNTPNTVAGTFVSAPAINIEKTASPSFLSVPGTVTYSYRVNNPGVVAMSSISVFDDRCSQILFDGGDVNGNSLLDLSEVWNYRCTAFVSATTTNTATATGRANNMTATDTATATVVVGAPITTTTTFVPTSAVSPVFTTQFPSAVAALPNTGFGPDEEETMSAELPLLFLSLLALPALLIGLRLKKRTL